MGRVHPAHPWWPGRSGSVQHVDCNDSIGAQRGVSGLQVVLGVVALPTSSSGPALQTSRTGADCLYPTVVCEDWLARAAGN